MKEWKRRVKLKVVMKANEKCSWKQFVDAELWRSRLYRSQILQVEMRLKALVEIYTMHSFAQLCNINFYQNFAKKFAFSKFLKFSKKLENVRKFLAKF